VGSFHFLCTFLASASALWSRRGLLETDPTVRVAVPRFEASGAFSPRLRLLPNFDEKWVKYQKMVAMRVKPATLMPAETLFSRSQGTLSMTRETQLDELLLRWEECRQKGKSTTAEELCADCPELLEELKKRISALGALDRVLAVTPSPDASTLTYEVPPKPAPEVWPILPGYEILDELGHTHMSVVYKVRNIAMDRIEALKMGLATRRFRIEIRATAKFQHPGIIRIYHAPAEPQVQPFFTMEFSRAAPFSTT
jgi:hypothetical protein